MCPFSHQLGKISSRRSEEGYNLESRKIWKLTTEVIIRLIIEAAAVIIPSSITILTLLTKKFYKHTIDNISFKIEEMAISNE
jgi:hypothetical protein